MQPASLKTDTAAWDWGIVAACAERMSKQAHITVSLCFRPGSATFDEVLPWVHRIVAWTNFASGRVHERSPHATAYRSTTSSHRILSRRAVGLNWPVDSPQPAYEAGERGCEPGHHDASSTVGHVHTTLHTYRPTSLQPRPWRTIYDHRYSSTRSKKGMCRVDWVEEARVVPVTCKSPTRSRGNNPRDMPNTACGWASHANRFRFHTFSIPQSSTASQRVLHSSPPPLCLLVLVGSSLCGELRL